MSLYDMQSWATSTFPNGKWENSQKTNWLISSPFREDKHPSFSIDIEKRCTLDRGTGEAMKLSDFCQKLGIDEPDRKGGSLPPRTQEPIINKNALIALDRWDKAQQATDDFPYLLRKGVGSMGLRTDLDQQMGQVLLIPACDASCQIIGLERISGEGQKQHLGEKKNTFYLIGEPRPGEQVFIAEGYATGASLHKITDSPVAISFSHFNLGNVANILERKGFKPTVCPDSGASLVSNFRNVLTPEGTPKGQDWNDFHQEQGLDRARELFREQEAKSTIRTEDKPIKQRPSLLDFRKHLEPSKGTRPEMIGGIFPRSGVSVIAGQQGTGKSLLMQKFCCDISRGGSILDGFSESISPVKSLYLIGEFSANGMNHRAQTASWQYDRENLILYEIRDFLINNIPLGLSTEEGFENIRQLIKEEKPDLIVFDSMMSFITANESDMQEMQSAFSKLLRIADEAKCAVVLVHHIRKRKAIERNMRLHMDDIIGSSIITRNASVAIGIENIKVDGENHIYVSSLKTWFAPIEEFSFQINRDSMKIFRGLEFNLTPKNPVANKTESIEHAVFKTYGDGTEFTVADIAEETGASESMIRKTLLEWKKSKRLKSTGKGKNISYIVIMQYYQNERQTQSYQGKYSATTVAECSGIERDIYDSDNAVAEYSPVIPTADATFRQYPMTVAEPKIDYQSWLDNEAPPEAKELYQKKFENMHKTMGEEASREKALLRTWEHFHLAE
ncbi:MAG: AAA family ATPase [Synergistaceae bacterium]|nr:AAA family ATPase [Synergistaceae bacterium]